MLASGGKGMWVTGSGTGIDSENNVSYNNTSEAQVDASANGTIIINYNDWFHNAGGTFMNYHGSSYSFANWTSNCSCDANSLSTDPLFTNGAGNVFTLTGSSPAIAAGNNLGTTYQNIVQSSSTWPSSVLTAPQPATWFMGVFQYP